MEVKSNIGEVTKDTKELTNEASKAAGEFQIMGVSLNGVKQGFASAAVTAKGMFGSIKSGLISTGIGAFVVLIGSLVAFFTKTKKGAELLEVAFAGLGAVVRVLTDAFSELGAIIIDTFTDPMPAIKNFGKGIISFIKDPTGATRDMFVNATLSAKTFTEELVKDTAAMINLKAAMQKLRDAERELNVETAQNIAFIEKQKLIAEDITKTFAEREEAATKAFDKETELETKRISLAEQAVENEIIRHSIMGKDGIMAEDLDALAELEINLANVRQESAGRQISLQNFLNGLRQTEATEIEAKREKEAQDAVDVLAEIAAEKKARQELYDFQIAQADALMLQFDKFADDEKKLALEVRNFKQDMALQGFGVIKEIAGEGTKVGKAAAIAQATMSGIQGVQNAFTAANANIALTAATAGAYPIGMAASAGVFAAINIAKIASGGGGGGVVQPPSVPTTSTPAPQMMSGAFDISGGVAPDAMKAFVVTDEMSNSQNQLANIRRRATI